MDNETKESLSKVLKEFNISENEERLIKYSDTSITAHMNHSRVIFTFLLTKQLKRSTEKIIESSRVLINAENRNSKIMQWLTGALIFVGIIQVISAIITTFLHCKI